MLSHKNGQQLSESAYKAKNSTTTGCFLLTRPPIVVFTIFATQLTAAKVDSYVSVTVNRVLDNI